MPTENVASGSDDGRVVRIGCGAGFAGDRIDPARDLAERGELDFLFLECLAERTLAQSHLARLANLSDSMRDLSSSTIETHLALVNNRMNEVMKVLTMVSTIFIPLSFIAGVYGMNFHFMPELELWWFYPLVWAVFLTIAVTMLIIFRSRKWI